MASKTVKIPNISCEHCTNTIEREMSELEGVTSVKADKDSKMFSVEWNEPPATWAVIADLLNEIGYPAEA
ncbi:heavy metal-binding protein [Candidatus Thiomargarita nelsonii]|uniref:Heavy metal-binding protein n=1 Tax=Candidatus Thiomargarita nelsonii TaxID=1003181 RepID=A0A0A6P1I7_9GAMM|nr:heavy metal-binding protein [Candidatus Thiomargarita nelsonii]